MLPTRDLIARIPGLAVHPRSLDALFTALNDPYVQACDLVAIVAHDIGLTSGMLRIVNAPLYRWSGDVSSVREARVRLGDEGFVRAAWNLSVEPRYYKDLYDSVGECDVLRRHGLAAATAAGELIEALGRADLYEPVFTAGLLHDLGRFVLRRQFSEARGVDPTAAEEAIRHADLAGDVAERLRLPRLLVASLRMQDDPDLAGEHVLAVRAVHGGALLSRMAGGELDSETVREGLSRLMGWGIPVERVLDLRDELQALLQGEQEITRMFLQSA